LRSRNLVRTRRLHGQLRAHNAELVTELRRQGEDEARRRAERTAKHERVKGILEDGAVTMVFQPIIELSRGRIVGYEALSRFEAEPRRGPDVWFAEAAEVGLGAEVELASIGLALEQLGVLPDDAFLTVNASPFVAVDPALHAMLQNAAGSRVVLEITEHVRVDDYPALVHGLCDLRKSGVRLAIDDAGAGYSSLEHILKLRPEIIKLDIALTRDIHTDPVKRALASALVSFAREIDATIIAEGIECQDELETLARLGVTWGQGYHLGRPGPLGPRAQFGRRLTPGRSRPPSP
jgi:EAL domain-containing protein (putative c-di-GMP-specific phosphodiesterase class I)